MIEVEEEDPALGSEEVLSPEADPAPSVPNK